MHAAVLCVLATLASATPATTLVDSNTTLLDSPLIMQHQDMQHQEDQSDDGLVRQRQVKFSQRHDCDEIVSWLLSKSRGGRLNHLGLGFKYGDDVIAPLHDDGKLRDLLDRQSNLAAMVVLGYEQGDEGVLQASPELYARGVRENRGIGYARPRSRTVERFARQYPRTAQLAGIVNSAALEAFDAFSLGSARSSTSR